METIYDTLNAPQTGAEAEHKDINLGTNIANYMARDSVNKLDSRPFNIDKGFPFPDQNEVNARNLEDEIITKSNAILRNLLERSDFFRARMEAGHYLSLYGAVLALWIYVEDKWYIQFLKIINYKAFNKDISRIVAHSFDVYAYNGQTPHYLRYELEVKDEKLISKINIVEPKSEAGKTKFKVIENKKLEYPASVNFIPGVIIKNNYLALPDFHSVAPILQEINVLSNGYGEEWEKIKTMFVNKGGLYGKGQSASSTQKQILSGKTHVFGGSTSNARFANYLEAFMSGSITGDILTRMILFLEDRALKYSFYGREMEGTGTNKHNMQVSLFNQANSEYINVKKRQRESDYTDFFKMMVPLGILRANKSLSLVIEILDSPYQIGKEQEALRSEYQNKLAAEQARAQIAKQKRDRAEAEIKLRAAFNGENRPKPENEA